jgi:bacterioferritin
MYPEAHMKGDSNIINLLNSVLKNELTAINQYFLHARMYRNWGFEELNEKCYKKSIQDMKHADRLIERILFLEGLPNLQDLGKLMIGEHAEEMLGNDLSMQMNHRSVFVEAIAACETGSDYTSREILEDLLKDEEDYIDWLESQQTLIRDVGIKNYLQSQISEGDD